LSKPNRLKSVRDILLCVLVFFGAFFLIVGAVILGVLLDSAIIAILVYLVLRYRDRVRELEKKPLGPREVGSSEVPSSSEP
jgi:hypothetical protein